MRRLVLSAAAAAAVIAAAGITVAGAAGTASTFDFSGGPLGRVTRVTSSDGRLGASVFGANQWDVGPNWALVAAFVGNNALSIGGIPGAPCNGLEFVVDKCPTDNGLVAPLFKSLRVVGANQPVLLTFLDSGGNPSDGSPVTITATGLMGSALYTGPVTFSGETRGISAVLAAFKGTGALDDLTFDCNCDCDDGEPPTPGLQLVKTASPTTVRPGQSVTYTYVVTNTGSIGATDIVVVDDNGTPGDAGDDFTAGTAATLAAGSSVTFTRTLVPLASSASGEQCAPIDGVDRNVGTLSVTTLPSGDIQVRYVQDRFVVDNTYGTGAVGYSRGHTFRDFVGSDKAEFSFTDATGRVVLAFTADYLSASASAPSGYATLGVTGGDGRMSVGSAANVLSVRTSMSDNLNQSPAFHGFTTNSPAPEASFPAWDYLNSYTIVVSRNAFGTAGFGGVDVVGVHNSPPKNGENLVEPDPCDASVTNVATVTATAVVDGDFVTLTDSDDATVTIDDGTSGDSGGKDPKEPKEPKPPKEPKDPKDPKDPKEPKDPKGHDGDDDDDDKDHGRRGGRGRGRGRR